MQKKKNSFSKRKVPDGVDVAKVGVVDPLARRIRVPPERPSRVSFINSSPSAKLLNHGLLVSSGLPCTQTGRCGVCWKGYQAHKAWGCLPWPACLPGGLRELMTPERIQLPPPRKCSLVSPQCLLQILSSLWCT